MLFEFYGYFEFVVVGGYYCCGDGMWISCFYCFNCYFGDLYQRDYIVFYSQNCWSVINVFG